MQLEPLLLLSWQRGTMIVSDVLGRAWAKSPGLGLSLGGLGPLKNPSPAQTSGQGWARAGPGPKLKIR